MNAPMNIGIIICIIMNYRIYNLLRFLGSSCIIQIDEWPPLYFPVQYRKLLPDGRYIQCLWYGERNVHDKSFSKRWLISFSTHARSGSGFTWSRISEAYAPSNRLRAVFSEMPRDCK